MTRYTLILALMSSLVPFQSSSETISGLILRDEIYYKKFTDVPFTGKVTGLSEGSVKNGKKEGPWIEFHRKRKLYLKGDYKDGKRDGSWTAYWSNGKLLHQAIFKNGVRRGNWNNYNDDGNIAKMFATISTRR